MTGGEKEVLQTAPLVIAKLKGVVVEIESLADSLEEMAQSQVLIHNDRHPVYDRLTELLEVYK